MRVTIASKAIEIDGQGGGVPVAEIQRVSALFAQMFGVEPRVRLTGRFERDAVGHVPGGDPNVSAWDLRQGSGSGYYPVLSVGAEYLAVQAWPGLNNGRSIALAPERGTMVRVRLLLPG